MSRRREERSAASGRREHVERSAAGGRREHDDEGRNATPRAPTESVWEIERIVAGGAALARLSDGRVGLVHGALPGERIAIDEFRERRGFAEALRFHVLEAAPERVEPRCPIANDCGGCDFLHVEETAALRFKADIVRDALRRQGGVREPPPFAVQASPEPLRYRLRLRAHIDEQGRVGFLGRSSHRLVETGRCAVALPELETALEALHATALRHPAGAALFAEAELRVAPVGPSPLIRLTRRGPRRRGAANPFLEELARHASVVIDAEPTELEQRFPLGEGLSLIAPPRSFVQVNWGVNRQIVASVLAGAEARGIRTFLDLYAGAGNFLLPLLRAGFAGMGVESEKTAARAAGRAADELGLKGEVLALPVEAALERLVREGRRFELVILDPPRSGAAAILAPLLTLAPEIIAYCSCDPPTWARDLRILLAAGYALESVEAFDMFPGTHHVETLAWLRRVAPKVARPSGHPR